MQWGPGGQGPQLELPFPCLVGLSQPRVGWSEVAPGQLRPDTYADAVWLCVGLPMLAPAEWSFGRGRWLALAALLTLWFLPSLLGDDDYSHVLRVFVSIVALALLLVWRTPWRLTKPA
jgi:hypothetical protein